MVKQNTSTLEYIHVLVFFPCVNSAFASMGCKVSCACILSLTAKVACIFVLILQSTLLDYVIVQWDTSASDVGRYIWIAFDALIVIFWIIAMIMSHRFFHNPNQQKVPTEGYTGKQLIILALKELPFAYVSWLFYAIVLVAKINAIFTAKFAEALTSSTESLRSNTSLKIILSLAGVIFALMAYAHHNEAHNSKYKLLIEKIGTAASIDLLDVIMLLDILFVNVSRVLVTFTLDRTIRTFASICILLPVLPLVALRVISSSGTAKTDKVFPMVMVLNSALYLFLVNIPLLIIRMFLWVHHDVDVTTFLTKNVLAICKGCLDIYRELVAWRREVAKEKKGNNDEVQMEPVVHV
ncbi:uncharacterized protein LOC110985627 [Acanthaster planci]|uniref:Uncharacterized protein LOC110985627 n=1 Tax=Acanthaster planci TaxID=133434 RepID=A0A8B7ZBW9_ACAPL|nr:uncharacterized protein LOC110985627 [Acanthaster planci]XP_022102467.1 uncharacterized protein LOC110985627 [Acanthaster planci]